MFQKAIPFNRNSKVKKETAITDMLLETKKALNDKFSTIACDNAKQPMSIAKRIFKTPRPLY